VGGEILFGDFMLALSHRAIHNRDLVSLGPGAKATAESPRHTHEMRIIEALIGAVKHAPPTAKAPFADPHWEVRIQDDPIHAIVAALQKILIMLAKLIPHGASAFRLKKQFGRLSRMPAGSQPAGSVAAARRATFSAPSRRKSVEPIH
jgi:hypothetical protein